MTGTIDDTATTLPDASFTYPLPARTPLPLASGTRKECYQYADGDEWQVNITSTYFSSQCAFFAAVMGVTLEDLQVWNPSENTQIADVIGNLIQLTSLVQAWETRQTRVVHLSPASDTAESTIMATEEPTMIMETLASRAALVPPSPPPQLQRPYRRPQYFLLQ